MSALLPIIFDGFDALAIPQSQSWQAVPLPISRTKQSLLWEQQGMIPPNSARDLPDTDDRDSLSARTVSSVEHQRRSSVKAGRRVTGPGIVHTVDTNWRFLAATGDYASSVPTAQPTLPRPPPLPLPAQPPLVSAPPPPPLPHPHEGTRVLPTPASVGVTSSQVPQAAVAAEAKAALSRVAVLLHLEQATAPPLPEHSAWEGHHGPQVVQAGPLFTDRRHAPPVYHVPPHVLSRHSRVAFLAQLPSSEFTQPPRPRLPGTTRQTIAVSAAAATKAEERLVGASMHLDLTTEAGSAVTSAALLVHNSPKNDALRQMRRTQDPAAVRPSNVGGHFISVVDLRTTQPPSPANAAGTRSLLSGGSSPGGVTRSAADDDDDNNCDNRTRAAPRVTSERTLQATQTCQKETKSPVRPLVGVEELGNKLLSPVSPSRPPSLLTPAAVTPKSRRSSLSTRQLRMKDSVYTKAYRLLQHETTCAEDATLQEVPLLPAEALPVEEELVVRMQLQQWYLTLHPLDDVDIAEGLPPEMINKLAVTARGVPVNVICDKSIDARSAAGKSLGAGSGVYCATRELDFVSYRQWHRPPGYVDPTLLIGSHDLEARTAFISSLRDQQREAEQYFGLQPTYTRIPPPLLPDEHPLATPPQEGVLPSNKTSSRKQKPVGRLRGLRGSEGNGFSDLLLPHRQALRTLTIDALEDASAAHPGKLIDLFHSAMFQSITGP